MSIYAPNRTFSGIESLVQGPSGELLNALAMAKQAYDDFGPIKTLFGSNATDMAANLPDVPTIYKSDGQGGQTTLKTPAQVMADIFLAANDLDYTAWDLSSQSTTISAVVTHLRAVAQFNGASTGLTGFYAGEATYQSVKALITTASERLVKALYKCYAASDAFGRIEYAFGAYNATALAAVLLGIPTVYGQTDVEIVTAITVPFSDFDKLEAVLAASIMPHLLTLAQWEG